LIKYPAATTHLSLLNLAMRMAGPREALWHGIIRKQPRLHPHDRGPRPRRPRQEQPRQGFLRPLCRAGTGSSEHAAEIGIEMVDFKQMVYVQERAQYYPDRRGARGLRPCWTSRAPNCAAVCAKDWKSPTGSAFHEVVAELRRTSPARQQAGLHRLLHGPLRVSGKSTIANALMVKLMEMGGRPVTLLDGDVVRKHLSSELGFSKEHRDINIKRIGYVASEITKNGGIAICAPIAPYTATRRAVREMIESFGAFIEVHVATSLAECERRDRKGLYKLAREGKIKEFTGISDPYEAPTHAELVVDTENVDVDHCAHQVILKLESMGLIRA
jgi:sulfate adenylyltransferase